MSLLTQAHLLDRYGPRLTVEETAEVLGISFGTARNQISQGRFPVKTFMDFGRRFVDYRDLSEHIDHARDSTNSKREN